jgi:hypothetical protein
MCAIADWIAVSSGLIARLAYLHRGIPSWVHPTSYDESGEMLSLLPSLLPKSDFRSIAFQADIGDSRSWRSGGESPVIGGELVASQLPCNENRLALPELGIWDR